MCMRFPVFMRIGFGHVFICGDFIYRVSRIKLRKGYSEALTIGLKIICLPSLSLSLISPIERS